MKGLLQKMLQQLFIIYFYWNATPETYVVLNVN